MCSYVSTLYAQTDPHLPLALIKVALEGPKCGRNNHVTCIFTVFQALLVAIDITEACEV